MLQFVIVIVRYREIELHLSVALVYFFTVLLFSAHILDVARFSNPVCLLPHHLPSASVSAKAIDWRKLF
jgi:hypothetical protein